MNTESLQTLSQIIIAIGIALTVAGGFGAYYFGKKNDTIKESRNEVVNAKLTNQITDLQKDLTPFREYAKKLFPSDNDSVALKKLEDRLNTSVDEKLLSQTVQTEQQMAELTDAAIEFRLLIERIDQFDRNALDELLRIRNAEASSQRGKLASRIIKQKALDIIRYMTETDEGKTLKSGYTRSYYKGIDETNIKKKLEIAIYEIETQNNLTEVAWGFLELKNLGYTNIKCMSLKK